MAHNPPVFPLVLPDHYVVTPGNLDALDQYASESLDGANGGTYAPSSPIRIGGAGLDLRGTSRIRGNVATGRDAVGITLSNSAYPAFATPRTRTVMIPLRPLSDADALALRAYEHVFEPAYGIRSIATSQKSIVFMIPSHRLHHGATIQSLKLRWRSGAPPSSLSTVNDASEIPLVRIVRVKKEGLESTDYAPNVAELWAVPARANSTAYAVDDIVHSTGGAEWSGSNGYTYRCVQPGVSAAAQPAMSTTIGGNTTDGGVIWRTEYGHNNPFIHYQWPAIPDGADPSVFYAGGVDQDLRVRVNMNATIDTASYDYLVELLEPGGDGTASYGNLYHSLVLDLAAIAALKEP